MIIYRASQQFPILVCAFGIILTSSVQAAPSDTFESTGAMAAPDIGNPDGFPGTPGNGWATSWELATQDTRSEIDANVIDTEPFEPGSGGYLQLAYTRHGGNAGSRAGIVRQISNFAADGGIDQLAPYEIKFQFRIDEASGEFNQLTDQIVFAESLEMNEGNPSSKDRWVFLYRGGSGKPGEIGGIWTAFFHGFVNDGPLVFGPKNFSIQPGTVCEATVSVDPVEGTWDVEISYQGEVFRASDANTGLPLKLMNKAEPVEPTILSFRTSRNGNGSTLLWSIDNVQLTQ